MCTYDRLLHDQVRLKENYKLMKYCEYGRTEDVRSLLFKKANIKVDITDPLHGVRSFFLSMK